MWQLSFHSYASHLLTCLQSPFWHFNWQFCTLDCLFYYWSSSVVINIWEKQVIKCFHQLHNTWIILSFLYHKHLLWCYVPFCKMSSNMDLNDIHLILQSMHCWESAPLSHTDSNSSLSWNEYSIKLLLSNFHPKITLVHKYKLFLIF